MNTFPFKKGEVVVVDDYKHPSGRVHLAASSVELLHRFAHFIHVNKCWFDNRKDKNHPHYDIKGIQIKRAKEAGAFEISHKDLPHFFEKYYGNNK